MFERFSRSWTLVKASGSVLMQDKELLVFPFISSIMTLIVAACFVLPALGMGALDGMTRGDGNAFSIGFYVIVFLFYLSQYFVIFFFNSALVGAAMIRLEGGDPTVSDGLRIATSRAGAILGYAFIAATVGMILRAIQERVGFIGKIIVAIIGVGWTLATALVVPVLVSKDVGPVEAVKESALLLKETWGENIIGHGGIGLAFGFIQFGVVLTGIALVVLMVLTKSMVLIVAAIIVAVLAIMLTTLVQAALSGIYSAALYRYATTREGTAGFDSNALQQAFGPAK
jgi:hypothetical protein